MEQGIMHLVHAALWIMLIIFALALVGLVAIIKWIVDAFRKTEQAVETGVQNVEGHFKQ